MQSNDKKIESIWADGCPENVKDEYKLNIGELLSFAVDYIVKVFCIPEGFKVEQVVTDLEHLPNIVMKKNDKLYAIYVVPFLYPMYGVLTEKVRKNVVEVTKGYNATAYFCPIGFKSKDKARAEAGLALKGDLFDVMFKGFIELKDEDNQNLAVELDQFTYLENA